MLHLPQSRATLTRPSKPFMGSASPVPSLSELDAGFFFVVHLLDLSLYREGSISQGSNLRCSYVFCAEKNRYAIAG